MPPVPLCRHIMPSGKRCGSPALSGASFCYYHANLNRVERARKNAQAMPFAPLEDLRGIQLALTQLFNLVDNPYSDTTRIKQMLSILRLATRIAIHAPDLPSQASPCEHCGHLPDAAAEQLEVEPSELTCFLPTETLPVEGATPKTESTDKAVPKETADELIERYKHWDRPHSPQSISAQGFPPAPRASSIKEREQESLRRYFGSAAPPCETEPQLSSVL